ncbi:cell wall-binding repeat-containing protein [Cryobacterium zhongshanensis]|uniref:alpha-amylase n=1 Tax=Cryobacterium zhongshanensis TaxID=2928153 RepID=A0AA41QV24_9MICO|nr:cell wall-binding repeat-containing protein [Cryobacterium zhongshanensis]MCI4658247.1 cell wall-binding repeat-containing protein [Cryobacterium zhongshanensis]
MLRREVASVLSAPVSGGTAVRHRGIVIALIVAIYLALGPLGTATPANAVPATPNTGSINGTVMQSIDGTESAAPNITVTLLSGPHSFSAQTGTDGHYSLSAISPGSYTVSFSARYANLMTQYYPNVATFTAATPVAIGAGSTVSAINAVLVPGAAITGTVTKNTAGTAMPAPNVRVTTASSTYPSWSVSAMTDSEGRYTLNKLHAGSYTLKFRDDNDPSVVSKWYGGGTAAVSATPLVLGPQTVVSGTDSYLEPTSYITGTVTQNVGGVVSAAQDVPVGVFAASTGEILTMKNTDVNGRYSLESLTAGTYKVSFDLYGTASSLIPEYYNNVYDLASATPITVGISATLAHIDAEVSDTGPISRLAGDDRFATSSVISSQNFEPGVSVAYIASGANFPDALSAAPVAGKDKAPVLLVRAGAIPQSVQTELLRLKPQRIVVFGGVSSISEAVATGLQAFTAGTVTRSEGADRFATSAAISLAAFTPGVPVVYIANGFNFPDALSAAPVAARDSAPVLLVPADGIPAEIATELSRLKPASIVVLGGENSVSDNVRTLLTQYTAGPITRISGADRFGTSAAVSKAAFPTGAATVYIANGFSFPDALSAAPVAGKTSAPVLLVPGDRITNEIRNELARLKPTRIVVLGGPNSVSAAVVHELLTYAIL